MKKEQKLQRVMERQRRCRGILGTWLDFVLSVLHWFVQSGLKSELLRTGHSDQRVPVSAEEEQSLGTYAWAEGTKMMSISHCRSQRI